MLLRSQRWLFIEPAANFHAPPRGALALRITLMLLELLEQLLFVIDAVEFHMGLALATSQNAPYSIIGHCVAGADTSCIELDIGQR